MRESIRQSIARITRKSHDFAAGNIVFYVPPGEPPIELRCVMWSVSRGEGLEVFSGGIEDQEESILSFLKEDLVEENIAVLDPAGFFDIDGERWDFSVGKPLIVNAGPDGGTHPEVQVQVRKATELEHSLDGESFGFQWETPS